MQSQGVLPPEKRPYKGILDCLKKTHAKDGIKGFWIGWGPNVVRNSLINAAEVTTYDQAKQMLVHKYGFPDQSSTHAMCAVICSANASLVGAPADIIKTRCMNEKDPAK